MITLHFTTHDGLRFDAEARAGQSVMEVAINANVPGVEAECGGCLTCCTCHLFVDPGLNAKLPPMSDEESELLEFAPERNDTSRLSCQLPVTDAMNGGEFSIPSEQI